MSFSIANCIANLPAKFGNRQNMGFLQQGTMNASSVATADGSLAVTAVSEAVKELTETYEFEELKYTTPVPPAAPLSLTISNPYIAIGPASTSGSLLSTIAGNTVFPQFQSQNITDITDIYTFWMWFSGGVNQAGRVLGYRRKPAVDLVSYGITNMTQGQIGVAPPVYFTRFGANLQVGPAPDQAYQYFVSMKLRHPFPVALGAFGAGGGFTPAVLLPVLVAGAVSRVTVTSGGSGYPASSSTIPVVFSTPISGVTATGTATSNSSGVITGITVTAGGSGYGTTVPSCNTAIVATQQVFMPDSWQEIVELCACQRLALWEGASDYITMFEAVLQGKGIDIAKAKARKSQMERDEQHNERSVTLRSNPYTFA